MTTNIIGRPSRRLSVGLPLAGLLLATTAGSGLAQSAVPSVPIGTIEHPTGAEDIVLSMETGGGFVPFGYFITQAPTFVLYGDNRVIFRPSTDSSGAELPAFIEATLSAEQVDALLTYALTEGGLADADSDYMEMTVSDAPTTVFTVDAAGVDKTVSVYALGIGTPQGPNAADYAAFEQLAEVLATFETQVENGQVLTAAPYEPELYRAVLSESFGDTPDAIDWPWADLTVEDFEAVGSNGYRMAGLTPDQIAEVTDVPSGGSTGIAVRSPDGETTYLLQFRPLLPGEPVQPENMGGKGF